MVNRLRKAWDATKNFVKKWWHKKPLVRASTAFVAGEGLFEGTFIIAAAVTYFVIGNWWMFALFCVWAFWEFFARAVVIKQVV